MNPTVGSHAGIGAISAIAATTPTTLSGSARASVSPHIAPAPAGRRTLALIGAAVVASAAIAIVVLWTRQSAPPAASGTAQPSQPTEGVRSHDAIPTTRPSAATSSDAPPLPPPARPAAAAPVLAPSVDLTPPAVATLDRAATPAPASAPPVVSTRTSVTTAEVPKRPAHVTAVVTPTAVAKKEPGSVAARREESRTPAIAAPIASTSVTEEVTSAQPKSAETIAVPPPVSKWSKLTGDKASNSDRVYDALFKLCKAAAAAGDCDEARRYAARIADKNVALYRARVLADSEIAACLRSK